MKSKSSKRNKKILNRLSSGNQNMKKKKNSKLKGDELIKAIKEAQKDPEFMKEVDRFIKATTTIHKLH